MPVVTVSSQISLAVYFVSIVGLAVLLARPVYQVYSASQERGAEVVASGLGAMVDSMTPGTSVVTRLEAYPGVLLSVSLSGEEVTASYGNSTYSAHVRWALQQATLVPGEEYNFTLRGGEVLVAPSRDS
jgi:hypothetical protein